MASHPKEVDDFAAQARQFIAWCDSDHRSKSAGRMQREALLQLSEVYAAALRLPDVEPEESAPDPPTRSFEERDRLAANLRLLPMQHYWVVFTPSDFDGDKEPVCGDLFDDFLDIYGDLTEGLWLYERGHIETAVFSWSFTFGVHWGRHAASAMHALHSLDTDEAAL